jgi:SH3 domain protein
MNRKRFLPAAGAFFLTITLSTAAMAETLWVSDVFEVTLRTGPTTSNAIQMMVESGTALEVLERDADAGYTRVRTNGGTEGWVLSRYLMTEASAREQLQTLTRQLTSANAEGSSRESQLGAIRGEYESAKRRIAELERSEASLQQELAEIRQTAANTLAIDSQNKSLQQQLTDTEIQVSVLEQANETLSGQTTRNWFITGALVLFGGVLLGLILPRMKWQKKSRYDSF